MSDTRPEWRQLRDALELGDYHVASRLLESFPCLINERNGIGETPVHFLAVENNRPAVEWLHSHGADMNIANEFGTPLLFEVAQLGHRELFLWMIQHGADLQQRNADGLRIDEYLIEVDQAEMLHFIKGRL